MSLYYSTNITEIEFLTQLGNPSGHVIDFGPARFEAYARLRFIPDPEYSGQLEADAQLRKDHPSAIEQSRRLLGKLAVHTTSPDRCYFCVWEGYSNVQLPAGRPTGSVVDLADRRYALLEGPLNGLQTWEIDFGNGNPIDPPAFVWPADHRWCFAKDVDSHWAGIGASTAAITALVQYAGLDVVAADPTTAQPMY